MARNTKAAKATKEKAASGTGMRTLMVRVTAAEHRLLRIKAAETETTMSGLARLALGLESAKAGK